MKLSAIVIVQNEEALLETCLKSLEFADEVIVVDGGSKDKTAEKATDMGAKVYINPWPGFAQQRNFGAKKANGDWLLFIDVDEVVTKGLKEEILEVISSSGENLFLIPRRNRILGRLMKYGGWYPDYQMRLVKKSDFRGWEGRLHEYMNVSKPIVKKLTNEIVHNTHIDISWMIAKTIKYASIEAELLLEAGHPKVKVKHFIIGGLKEFWYRGIKKLGFRDGAVGWIEIFYQVTNKFIIFVFLWELQQNEKSI